MSFLPSAHMTGMNVFGTIRTIIVAVFSIVKFTILSILRLGRWCWDRIHLG